MGEGFCGICATTLSQQPNIKAHVRISTAYSKLSYGKLLDMLRTMLAATTLLFALAPAQAIDTLKIDAAVERSMRLWSVPGVAVAVVRRDELVHARGYGVRELGRDERVTPRTVFAIGSTTKAFTAAAVAMLVDEGRMSWDDPVRKHIEFFRLYDSLADQAVTLRDLMSHRTGLSRNDVLWYDSPWSREELLRRLAYIKPSQPFRSVWQYNNLMFSAAGYAAGKAAGTTWEELVQKRIFDPLNMSEASFHVAEAQKSTDHATPHSLGAEGKREAVPWRALDNIGPAGAINSNVTDLSKWVRMQLNGGVFEGRRLVSAKNMSEMHTPQMAMRPGDWGRSYNPETHQMTYGLGWTLHDYRGRHLVSHGGAIDGFRANITLIPDEKLGIILLANLGQENMPEALRFVLIDILLGLPTRDWDTELREHFRKESADSDAAARKMVDARRKDTQPSLDLASYTGEFLDPGYGTVKITLEQRRLMLAWSNYRSALDHFHFDTFRIQGPGPGSPTVQFRLAEDATVRSLTYLGVEFAKRHD